MKRWNSLVNLSIILGIAALGRCAMTAEPTVGVRPFGGDSPLYEFSDDSEPETLPTRRPADLNPMAARSNTHDSYYDRGRSQALGQGSNLHLGKVGCDVACDAASDAAGDAACDISMRANKCGNSSCNGKCRRCSRRCALFQVGGWISGGMTYNSLRPQNPRAGMGNRPVGFNYRSEDPQINQAYIFIERATDTQNQTWDFGGRADILYGEDYYFTQSVGLEMHQDRNFKWNGNQTGNGLNASGVPGTGSNRNGIALPQAYLELAFGYLKVKTGHFYTTIGHESVMAVDNFFYSHSYTMQFGEPFTHTGILGSLDVTDQLTLFGGIHNGWNVWWQSGVTREQRGLLAGLNWVSRDGNISLSGMVTSGDDADFQTVVGVTPMSFSNRTMYSVVGKFRLTDRLESVLQHDYGIQTNGGAANGQTATWYGVNSYLMYTVSNCLRAGIRYEWFNDQNGFAIIGPGTGIGSQFHAISCGLNYKPRQNLMFRPEVRWDWQGYHNGAVAAGALPIFNAGNPGSASSSSQFTVGMDIIVRY